MLKVGLQLYSVRQHMASDWRDTLTKIAEAGYHVIEPANHYVGKDDGIGFGVSAAEMKAILSDTGLSVCNTHLYPMESEKEIEALPAILEYQKAIGSSRVTCAMGFFTDADQTKRLCGIFNRMGEVCRSYGADFLYHNHYHEFQIFPGQAKTVFDIMMEETDPALVKFELDTYWAARGAQDVPALMAKMGDRLLMLHQKDFPKVCASPFDLIAPANEANALIDLEYYNRTHTEDAFTEIGHGVLDIQSFIDAANGKTAADYIILEQDFTALDEIDSIRRSMEGFRKFSGVEW